MQASQQNRLRLPRLQSPQLPQLLRRPHKLQGPLPLHRRPRQLLLRLQKRTQLQRLRRKSRLPRPPLKQLRPPLSQLSPPRLLLPRPLNLPPLRQLPLFQLRPFAASSCRRPGHVLSTRHLCSPPQQQLLPPLPAHSRAACSVAAPSSIAVPQARPAAREASSSAPVSIPALRASIPPADHAPNIPPAPSPADLQVLVVPAVLADGPASASVLALVHLVPVASVRPVPAALHQAALLRRLQLNLAATVAQAPRAAAVVVSSIRRPRKVR